MLAHRGDGARDILAHDARLRPAQPEAHQAHEVGPAGHEMPHIGTDPGRPDLYQHVVVADGRPVDLLERQDIG